MCHQATRSAAARARGGIGGRCWRKLRPDQRAAIRRAPGRIHAALTRPAPAGDGQLPIEETESTHA